jgi:Txe/YoeB family toxin of Txe-Axe toxin-antitoxin module
VSLRVVFTPNAWQDFDGWLRRDMKMARRISKLIIDVQRDPQGTAWKLPPATATTSTSDKRRETQRRRTHCREPNHRNAGRPGARPPGAE